MPRKKKESRKYIPKDEFRYAKRGTYASHPQYVFGQTRKGKLKTFGLTHTHILSGKHKNIELLKNPDPNDTRKSYIGINVHTFSDDYLQSKEKGWKFSRRDRALVRHMIKKYNKGLNKKPKNWYVNKNKYKKR